MKLNGVQTELLDINEIRKMEPLLDYSSLRFPIIGALYQPTAATARHDAVVFRLGIRSRRSKTRR